MTTEFKPGERVRIKRGAWHTMAERIGTVREAVSVSYRVVFDGNEPLEQRDWIVRSERLERADPIHTCAACGGAFQSDCPDQFGLALDGPREIVEICPACFELDDGALGDRIRARRAVAVALEECRCGHPRMRHIDRAGQETEPCDEDGCACLAFDGADAAAPGNPSQAEQLSAQPPAPSEPEPEWVRLALRRARHRRELREALDREIKPSPYEEQVSTAGWES